MKYPFLERSLANINYHVAITDLEKTFLKINEDRKCKFIISANIFIGIIYACTAASFHFVLKNLVYHRYILIGLILLYLLALVFIIIYRKKQIAQNILNHVIFFLLYGIQVYWMIISFICGEELGILGSLCNLQFIMIFHAAIFLNFHVVLVIMIGLSNFFIALSFQIFNKFSHLYLSELSLAILNPIAALIVRFEYEKIVKILTVENQIMHYGDDLINDFPCFFFTFSNDKLIYINKAFNCYLRKNKWNTGTNREVYTHTHLENENISAEEFLRNNKLTSIKPSLKPIFDCHLHMTSKIEDLNLLQILSILQASPAGIQTRNFYYLGITESESVTRSMEKYQSSFYFRVMKSYNNQWVEVLMNDVTLCNHRSLVESVHTIRENLLAKLSHELKTPLMCIVGLLEDIHCKSEIISEEVKKKIKDAKNLASFLLFLINDIVNFCINPNNSNRGKEGTNNDNDEDINKHAVNNQNFKLKDVLLYVFEMLKTILKYNKKKSELIELKLSSGANVSLFSDSFRLKQILLHFISNAVKFTKSGYIKLSSEEDTQTILKQAVIISVEDSGIGIPNNQLTSIFSEKHFIDSYMANYEMGGAGLGLLLSHNISNMMGWELRVSSQEGQGSKFSICIPIQHQKQNENEITFPQENKLDEDNASRITLQRSFDGDKENVNSFLQRFECNGDIIKYEQSTEKVFFSSSMKYIMIIDDNNLIVQSLYSLLKKCFLKNHIRDFDVITGYDGADMINEIIKDQSNGNKIILTLLDENMEYIDGNDALQIIRKLEKKNRIKKNIVCKISAVREINEELCMLYDYCLNKPIKVEDIEKLLRIIQIIR